jgi:nucleoside-diphosphate-sugar epimerase
MPARNNVLLIGGAGAQGVPIVKALSADPQFTSIRILTRDPSSSNSQLLASLPRVSLITGESTSEPSLRNAFKDVDLAFVNLNGFVLGMATETYWGVRIFEIAVQSGVKHYIWSSLENSYADSGYNEEFRCGHFEGKARVAQWMSAQPQSPMKHSVITTGPYLQMLSELLRPSISGDGTYVFTLPVADGAVPFIHLDDIGSYVHWLLAHPDQATGMDLKVATAHVPGAALAEAFKKVTGHPTRYNAVSLDEWFTSGPLAGAADQKFGAQTLGLNNNTLMTVRENFTAWWKIYQASAGNKGLIKRDYELLDKILPDRVKSVEEWMRVTGYTGEKKSVLINYSGA